MTNSPRRLTPQEFKTLNLLLEGHSEKETAAKLGISIHTVHCYVKRIYRRFDVNTRSELLGIWIKELLKMVPVATLTTLTPESPTPFDRKSIAGSSGKCRELVKSDAVSERKLFASI